MTLGSQRLYCRHSLRHDCELCFHRKQTRSPAKLRTLERKTDLNDRSRHDASDKGS